MFQLRTLLIYFYTVAYPKARMVSSTLVVTLVETPIRVGKKGSGLTQRTFQH